MSWSWWVRVGGCGLVWCGLMMCLSRVGASWCVPVLGWWSWVGGGFAHDKLLPAAESPRDHPRANKNRRNHREHQTSRRRCGRPRAPGRKSSAHAKRQARSSQAIRREFRSICERS
ncbi:MAG: hypothetical protein DWI12_09090 [Planctomycetota bacterium]|nr:MAG: hypothetical protein DWI12_09090 [Planctomycetota bacterium]